MTDLPQMAAAKAAAKKAFCHTSLNLLLDDSGSITFDNWKKQVLATADAITHPDVLNAILRSNGALAIRAGQFSHSHQTMVDWRIIDSVESAHAFANELRAHANVFRSGMATDIGGALLSAVGEFKTTPCARSISVIDISTDGEANGGHKITPEEAMAIAKAAATANRVTINGIAIGGGVKADYLRKHVVTRDGFARDAEWDNYSEIIRRKIEIEVGNNKTYPDDERRHADRDEMPDSMPLPARAPAPDTSIRMSR